MNPENYKLPNWYKEPNPPMNITLPNVRLSYPNLFRAKAFSAPQPGQPASKPKFSAVALIDKKTQAGLIKLVQDGQKSVAEEKWGVGKVPKAVKYCLRDGSEKDDTDGYGDGIMFLNASSDKPVPVVDCDLSALSEASGKPYAGCYVVMLIRLWAQDNQFGKRVNAALRVVQFAKDGEPFGEGAVNIEKELKPIDDEGSSLD